MGTESLELKWGTLKGWNLITEDSKRAFRKYNAAGKDHMGAMQQRDTPEQKQAILELIDAIDGEIVNDWTGETMTKDDAKSYVTEYLKNY